MKNFSRQVLTLAVISTVALLSLGSCVGRNKKTVVTVLYSSQFENTEKLVEETFSDIDLQYERTPYSAEQSRRLKKGVGPDLLILDQPLSDDISKYFLDISDMQASLAYDGTVMQQIRQDGKSYLLPLPGRYNGFIVNETLMTEAGLSLPTTMPELIDDLVALKEKNIGVGEDQTNFAIKSDYNSEVGMFYASLMIPDFLGTVEGVLWMADFLKKEATVTGKWEASFAVSQQLIDAKVLSAAALSQQRNMIRYKARMGDGTLAMAFGTSDLFSDCVEENKKNVAAGTAPEYKYIMLPMLSSAANDPWVVLSPTGYIGINATAGTKKIEACRRVLNLLSTDAGQDALVADLNVGISYLRGYESDDSFIPDGLQKYIKTGNVYTANFPDKVLDYLGSNARSVFAGKSSVAEALAAVDKYYQEGSESVDYNLSVVGVLDKDLLLKDFNVRFQETEIGNFIADSIAEVTDTPIAVVNGGGIRGSFYKGEVYGSDLSDVCPFGNLIVVVEMNGQTIWEMLENSLAAYDDDFPAGRFLQVSGIKYTFDSRQPIGSRLQSLAAADGKAIDLNATYRVAINDYMAGRQGYAEGNGDGFKMLNVYDPDSPLGNVVLKSETGLTYRDALAAYFNLNQGKVLTSSLDGRIVNLAKNG